MSVVRWTNACALALAFAPVVPVAGCGDDADVEETNLRGSSSDAEGALGVAVRGDVAAVFADDVRAAATPLLGRDVIERAVTLHQLGHLLGLVDLFLDTGRDDPEHPGHSASRDSVMYWAVETGMSPTSPATCPRTPTWRRSAVADGPVRWNGSVVATAVGATRPPAADRSPCAPQPQDHQRPRRRSGMVGRRRWVPRQLPLVRSPSCAHHRSTGCGRAT